MRLHEILFPMWWALETMIADMITFAENGRIHLRPQTPDVGEKTKHRHRKRKSPSAHSWLRYHSIFPSNRLVITSVIMYVIYSIWYVYDLCMTPNLKFQCEFSAERIVRVRDCQAENWNGFTCGKRDTGSPAIRYSPVRVQHTPTFHVHSPHPHSTFHTQ